MPVTVQVKGAQELGTALTQAPTTVAAATLKAMQTSLLLIEADAKRNVAHDTRGLMNSITSQIRQDGQRLVGQAGPSVAYGVYVETGTRPHWPPLGALVPWARRHGVNPRLVQVAIARRGTRAQPYLMPAYQKNADKIVALFAGAGQAVAVTIAGATRGAGAAR